MNDTVAGMTIQIDEDLASSLRIWAECEQVDPATLAIHALRRRFLIAPKVQPKNDWERRLFGAAIDCGVSLSDEAVSSEGIYE